MSVPSQPSDPQNRRACHAASTPRPAAADAGPPIIPEPELEDYPNPPQQDEATGASGDASPPRPPAPGPTPARPAPRPQGRRSRSTPNRGTAPPPPGHLATQRSARRRLRRLRRRSVGWRIAQRPGTVVVPPECAIIRHVPFSHPSLSTCVFIAFVTRALAHPNELSSLHPPVQERNVAAVCRT
jgi:hypothetical protein